MYFTVCIPTYNRLKTINRALDSLEKQTFRDFEVIIVDDGSVDQTEVYIERYKRESDLQISFIKKNNGGKHTALNKGLALAKGALFIILDSDDWLATDALQIMHDMWEGVKDCKEPQYSGIIGLSASDDGNIIGRKFGKECYTTSYIDIGYGKDSRLWGANIVDCLECNRTDVVIKHLWPEVEGTHFVPESYVFDLIGLEYCLLATNNVLRYVEYQDDGITMNAQQFKNKNIIGYLEKYKQNIQIISKSKKINYSWRVIFWYQYWSALHIAKSSTYKSHVKEIDVSLAGYVVKFLMPLLSVLYRIIKNMGKRSFWLRTIK